MKKMIVFVSLAFICTACGPSISTSFDWDDSFPFSDLSTYAWALSGNR